MSSKSRALIIRTVDIYLNATGVMAAVGGVTGLVMGVQELRRSNWRAPGNSSPLGVLGLCTFFGAMRGLVPFEWPNIARHVVGLVTGRRWQK
jgi:hypothetical protein